MIKKKEWKEFRECGMLWLVNCILHLFGWVIVYNKYENSAYPARTKFRGFDNESNSSGYIQVSEYLKDNIEELCREARE